MEGYIKALSHAVKLVLFREASTVASKFKLLNGRLKSSPRNSDELFSLLIFARDVSEGKVGRHFLPSWCLSCIVLLLVCIKSIDSD